MPRHVIGITCLRTIIVAINTDTTAGDRSMLSLQTVTYDIGISKPMVLRFIFKRIRLADAFYTITAGDGIADKFYLPVRESWSLNELTSLIKNESLEFRFTEQAFYHIHHLSMMHPLWQSRSQGYNRIAFGIKAHFERFATINLRHEISSLRATQHFQRRPLKTSLNRSSRIIETSYIRILSKTHTSNILNHRMRSLYYLSLNRKSS